MPGRHWLDRVEGELKGRRLPRQEVARLIAELSDHLADVNDSRTGAGVSPGVDSANGRPLKALREEPMNAPAVLDALGSPVEIADAAVREFRRRNLLSRSRLAAFCTFVMLPLPLLAAAWVATVFGIVTVGEWLGFGGEPAAAARDVGWQGVLSIHVLVLGTLLAPATGLAALFGRLARRTPRRWLWGTIACLLVALTTALATTSVQFSERPGKSNVSFGLGIGAFRASQLGQLLVPLATGLLVLSRSGADRRFRAAD